MHLKIKEVSDLVHLAVEKQSDCRVLTHARGKEAKGNGGRTGRSARRQEVVRPFRGLFERPETSLGGTKPTCRRHGQQGKGNQDGVEHGRRRSFGYFKRHGSTVQSKARLSLLSPLEWMIRLRKMLWEVHGRSDAQLVGWRLVMDANSLTVNSKYVVGRSLLSCGVGGWTGFFIVK
jgi:hypothetical protein